MGSWLSDRIRIIGDAEHAVLIDEEKFEVSCFPVYHSVPTHGFKFTEKKRKRILLPAKLQAYEIPKYFYKNLTGRRRLYHEEWRCHKE